MIRVTNTRDELVDIEQVLQRFVQTDNDEGVERMFSRFLRVLDANTVLHAQEIRGDAPMQKDDALTPSLRFGYLASFAKKLAQNPNRYAHIIRTCLDGWEGGKGGMLSLFHTYQLPIETWAGIAGALSVVGSREEVEIGFEMAKVKYPGEEDTLTHAMITAFAARDPDWAKAQIPSISHPLIRLQALFDVLYWSQTEKPSLVGWQDVMSEYERYYVSRGDPAPEPEYSEKEFYQMLQNMMASVGQPPPQHEHIYTPAELLDLLLYEAIQKRDWGSMGEMLDDPLLNPLGVQGTLRVYIWKG
jgi:hypothetical protein